MVQLEDLKAKVQVRGLVHDGIATLISVEPSGTMVNLVYKDAQGQLREEVLDASQLAAISLVEPEEQAWSFAGDGEAFRLVSEAQRIRLAH